jgi:dTDP-4-dehydrorhamnose reductase
VKVFVVACDAQIRSALASQFERRHRDYTCVGPEWWGVEKGSAVSERQIPKDVGVVVNLLSFECLEQGVDEALVDDLSILAQACDKAEVPLIHLSSSQVFDGAGVKRKREVDDVVAVSDAGLLFVRMEALVKGLCRRHIVLRTGPLFCAEGDNPLTRLLREFENGRSVSLSKKGKSCPVHTMDLARVISAIIDQLSCVELPSGIYHYCSSDPASSYQFGESVLAVASQYVEADQSLILEREESDDDTWSRPQLNCEKIFHTFGIKQLPWRAFMASAVEEAFAQD